MRDLFFIIIVGVLVYLGISTIVADASLIGKFGELFAKENINFFGYISYGYLFFGVLSLYFIYKQKSFSMRKVEIGISSLLLFFSLLIVQAIVVSGEFRGHLGSSFVDFLAPFVGLVGVWIFWFITTLVSLTILVDKNISEFLSFLKIPQIKIPKPSINLPVKPNVTFSSTSVNESEIKVKKEVEESLMRRIDDNIEEYEELKDEVVEKEVDKVESLLVVESDIESNEKIDETEKLSTEVTEVIEEEPNSIDKVEDKAEEIKTEHNAVIVGELEENKKLLEQIETGKVEKPKDFKLPSTEFLEKAPKQKTAIDEKELDEKIGYLIEKLEHFKIQGDVVRTYAGPVVSTFEFKPAANVKVSKILNLQDDLAMALRAQTIRIQAPIPGKDVVGIEIPNETVETIYLREILESELFQSASSPLTIVLGKDIVGNPFITDLKKLPHLLIAGTTGSGKSVGINSMILSLLYKNSPDDLKLLMIDPKMLEFSIYNDIPHLLTPVITKAKQAIVALQNMVYEMERRYKLMSETRTKNIDNYNEKAKKEGTEVFPFIVVIIDELADLMMTSGKEVEYSIARLAQMARASGIHLIVATQRPSVDVVTGLIKANLPSRISYKVGQRIDSKIILDTQGAESLLGRGDMLFTPPGMSGLVRLHAPWSSETEIEEIVEFLKDQREVVYDKKFLQEENELSKISGSNESNEELDELYQDAKHIVISENKTSISYLQRRLQIGYNRSARIIEQLENQGILSQPNAKGNREIVGG